MAQPASERRSKKQQRRWQWIVLTVVIVVIAYSWWSASNRPTQTPTQRTAGFGDPRSRGMAVPVKATVAEAGSLTEQVSAIGTIQAFNTVTVRSRVEGELIEVRFKEGDLVQAGDVLALIDPRAYALRLEQSKGQLAQHQAQLRIAENDLRRYRKLASQDSISTQQLETQEATVAQLKGSVQSSQAAVNDAQLQLDYTTITAPIAGRLGLRNVDVGNLISSNSTEGLVVITQTQPIAASFSLPQQDLQRVFERMQAEQALTVGVYDSVGETLAMGSLLAVDNEIDVSTGTVRMKASIPNNSGRLFPNQFVSVGVMLGEDEGVVVPTQAIQLGSVGNYVYVIDDERKVSVQPVELGVSNGTLTVVHQGLAPNARVVTEGADRLREGSTVEVISTESAESAQAEGVAAEKPESVQPSP